MSDTDFSALSRRKKLAEVVDNHYTPGSVYIPAVGCINQVLQHFGVGLSARALNGISDNIHQVYFNKKSEAASSMRESIVFALDTFDALNEGRFSDAVVNASGSIMNAAGSMLYFANYDRERLSLHERVLFDAMHL